MGDMVFWFYHSKIKYLGEVVGGRARGGIAGRGHRVDGSAPGRRGNHRFEAGWRLGGWGLRIRLAGGSGPMGEFSRGGGAGARGGPRDPRRSFEADGVGPGAGGNLFTLTDKYEQQYEQRRDALISI